ncbi:MAG: hypothetical protein JSS83_02720 [Cyanobacteria bacterium SZAS LIN-3]|nr:hypothetical protein [Cyanobacteria bacterium SZAS LIN-3]
MTRAITLLIGILLVGSVLLPVNRARASSNRQADILLKKAFTADLDEDYKAAESEYISLIKSLKATDPGSDTILRAKARLARVYIVQGKFDEAEPLFVQLIHTDKETLARDPEIMVDLDDLSDAYVKLNKSNRFGYESLKRALMLRRYINPRHPHLAEAYRELAKFCLRCANYKDAIAWISKSIETENGLPLRKQSNLITDETFLAGLYLNSNQPEAAQKTALWTLAQIQKCTCGQEMDRQLHSILGRTYTVDKRFDDAEKEFKLAEKPTRAGAIVDGIMSKYIKEAREKNELMRNKARARHRSK